MSPARLLLAATLLALAPCLRAAAPPAHPLPPQINAWIAQLGDEDAVVRRRALLRLRAAGIYAEPALEKAAAHPDAEVRRSVRLLLANFRRGLFPDTPDNVAELIIAFEVAADRKPILRKLLAAGPTGCRAVVRLARHERHAATRKQIFADVFAELTRAVPALVEFNDLAALESLLELALDPDGGPGARHFAAFHLLDGSLPRQLERLSARDDRHLVEVLAYLHRANSDVDRAVVAAKRAGRDDLAAALLYEKGDWAALREYAVGPAPHEIGTHAAYARLAGDEKAHLALVQRLLDPKLGGIQNVWPIAKALFLNGRTADALAILAKANTRPRLRYDLLVLRWQIADATAVLEQARKSPSSDLHHLEIAHARTLHNLGDRKTARETLTTYADRIVAGLEAYWLGDLVEAELAVGGRAKAVALAAKILGTINDGHVSAQLFDKLFGDEAEEAASLWVLLRRPPVRLAQDDALHKIDELLAGKATKMDVQDLMKGANNVPPNTSDEQQTAHWLAAGDAAFRASHDALAAECFRKAKSLDGTIRLGDLEARKDEWTRASPLYVQAFGQGRRELAEDKVGFGIGRESRPALALYLYGHALGEAGMARDGNRRREQAHLMHLGSAALRSPFMADLKKRGHKEAASREGLYLRRLGEPILLEPWSQTAEGFRAAGHELMEKQPLKAADEFEKSFLRALHPDLNFARHAAYVTVPATLYRLRAVGLAQAGKYDEALREAARCRAVMPGNVDLARMLMPVLVAGGRKKDADELYKVTKATYDDALKAHPKSGLAHNQLGWLAATCKRDLEKGLQSARKAVELSPDDAGYHDTLAEVLFQLGKKKEAIEAQKRAIELAPRREVFVRQLKRIEAGDPKVPRPEP